MLCLSTKLLTGRLSLLFFIKKKMCTIYSTAVFRANAVKDNISLGSVDKRENSISSLILFSEIENIV